MTHITESPKISGDPQIALEPLDAGSRINSALQRIMTDVSNGIGQAVAAADAYTTPPEAYYFRPVKSTGETPIFIDTRGDGHPTLPARAGTLYARLEMAVKDRKAPLSADATRASLIREKTASLRRKVVEKLHEEFPGLTPDALNIIAAVGVGIGAAAAAVENEKGADRLAKAATTTEIVASSLLDAFDGELARLLERLFPGSVDFFKGQLKDVVSDRFQELFLWLSHYYAAKKRGDGAGEAAALSSMVTNVLPSIARAYAEKQGHAVPETGTKINRFFGSRFGRAVVGIVGAVYPEIKSIPIQAIGDVLVAVANIINTYERLRAGQSEAGEEVSPEKMHEAKARLITLCGVAVASLVVAGGAVWVLRDKDHQ